MHQLCMHRILIEKKRKCSPMQCAVGRKLLNSENEQNSTMKTSLNFNIINESKVLQQWIRSLRNSIRIFDFFFDSVEATKTSLSWCPWFFLHLSLFCVNTQLYEPKLFKYKWNIAFAESGRKFLQKVSPKKIRVYHQLFRQKCHNLRCLFIFGIFWKNIW